MSESYIQLNRDNVQIASGSEHIVTALSEKEVEKSLFLLFFDPKQTLCFYKRERLKGKSLRKSVCGEEPKVEKTKFKMNSAVD